MMMMIMLGCSRNANQFECQTNHHLFTAARGKGVAAIEQLLHDTVSRANDNTSILCMHEKRIVPGQRELCFHS